MNYFFYGTLLDPTVLVRVLGRRVSPAYGQPAVLPRYRAVYRRGATYPVLVADAEAETTGRIVWGISHAEAQRLGVFEGSGYRRVEVEVTLEGDSRSRALAFLPYCKTLASTRPWQLNEWRRKHRSRFVTCLQGSAPAPRH